jgi:hypothetical protein
VRRPIVIGAGDQFGRLTVLTEVGRNLSGRRSYSCQCACGSKLIVSGLALHAGNTRSCGCLRRELISRPRRDLAERFWEKVNKNGPLHPVLGTRCWEWMGSKGKKQRYGMLGIGRHVDGRQRNVKAHRLGWFLATGKWPTKNLCHKCDNEPCVRQDHLFEGSQSDNMKDALAKGRLTPPVAPSRKLNAEKIVEIRRRAAAGETQIDLGIKFGVQQAAISKIVLRKAWRCIP